MMHVREPYSTHDLINILLKLPIELENAMYVEGGSEAQLYIKSRNHEFEFLGKSETFILVNDGKISARPIPNVIGVVRKKRKSP